MRALIAKDFAGAIVFAERLGERAMCDLKEASPDAARTAISEKAISQLSDALHLARVLRAHLSAEISTNTGDMFYRQADLEQPRWRIRA